MTNKTIRQQKLPDFFSPIFKASLPKLITTTLLLVLSAVLIESTFFNYAYWKTVRTDPAKVQNVVLGKGLRQEQHGIYKVTKADEAFVKADVRNPSGKAVRLESIKISAEHFKNDEATRALLQVRYQGSEHWSTIRPSGWAQGVQNLRYAKSDSTQYVLLRESRGIEALKINYAGLDNTTKFSNDYIAFDSIIANPTVPFTLNIARVFLLIMVGVFILSFRPSSALYNKKFTLSDKAQLAGVSLVIVLGIVSSLLISQLNPHAFTEHFNPGYLHWQNPNQYNLLAEALLQGHSWLDLPVDPGLMNLQNPYDPVSRRALVESTGAKIYWDYAFFDGKYYSYFGVIPAILLFAPYQALTRQPLPSWIAVAFFITIFIIFLAYVIIRISQKWFQETASFGTVLLAILVSATASNAFYYVFIPNFYAIPISAAMCVTSIGLALWLGAGRSDGTLSKSLIALGSLFIALNLGCRPQFMLSALLAFPIFWREITQTRFLFSRKGLWNTIIAFLPFMLISIPVLYYNKLRFDSFLNFGANYNLTSFDMTAPKIFRDIRPSLLFLQLFQPSFLTGTFPFIEATDNKLNSPAEPSMGGMFLFIPVLLLSFCFFALKRQLQKRSLYGMCILLFGCGLLVCFVDISNAAVTNRYIGDYAWLFVLLMSIVLFQMEATLRSGLITESKTTRQSLWQIWSSIVSFSCLVTLTLSILSLFATGRFYPLIETNPDLFLTVKSWFLGVS